MSNKSVLASTDHTRAIDAHISRRKHVGGQNPSLTTTTLSLLEFFCWIFYFYSSTNRTVIVFWAYALMSATLRIDNVRVSRIDNYLVVQNEIIQRYLYAKTVRLVMKRYCIAVNGWRGRVVHGTRRNSRYIETTSGLDRRGPFANRVYALDTRP